MKKNLLLAALACSTVLVSCSDEGGDFSLVASNALEAAYADETELSGTLFRAKQDWTVVVEGLQPAYAAGVDWMRLLVGGNEVTNGGPGSYPLSIELETNYTGEDRAAKITFSRKREKDIIFVITVTQSGTGENGEVPAAPLE